MFETRWSMLATLAMALLPGIAAHFLGRGLLAVRESAVFAERWLGYQQRLGTITAFTWMAGVVWAAGWLWAIPVGLLGVLVGIYPTRRRIFEESWSLSAYLDHSLRFVGSLLLFWVLLAFGPGMVFLAGPGPQRWVAWGALAVALIAWNFGFDRWVVRLMRATPILDPALLERFGAVLARARVAAPEILRAGTPGGRWPQALALPDRRRPRVIMGDTLIGALSVDETAAIFAHEVAHLEHHAGELRRLSVMSYLLIAGALALVPLCELLEWPTKVLVAVWMALVVVHFARRTSGHKTHETASDRRAVELCGDAEALVRALIKVHALASIPRRWAVDFEASASHPSLSSRIQSIRGAAGLLAPTIASEHLFAGNEPGCYLVFGPEELEILREVPAGTEPTVAEARAGAGLRQTLPYRHMVELRLEPAWSEGARLVGRHADGMPVDVRLGEIDIAALQAVLDTIDDKLHTRTVVPRTARRTSFPMMLGWAITVMAAWWGGFIVPALLVGLRGPNVLNLTAAGVAALATAVAVSVRMLGPVFRVLWDPTTAAVSLAIPMALIVLAWPAIVVATAVSLLRTAARFRRAGQGVPRTERRLTIGLLAAGLVVCLAIYVYRGWLAAQPTSDYPPDAGVLAFGLAATLVTRRRTPLTVAAATALGLVGLLPMILSFSPVRLWLMGW
jgi:Zn-dependent protease with chaperone function